MKWPTKEEAENAEKFQLAVWYRFLPMCETEEQVEVVNIVYDRFTAMGGFNPALSKAVGLDKEKHENPAPAQAERELPIYCERCGRRFFLEPKKTYEQHLPWCESQGKSKKGG